MELKRKERKTVATLQRKDKVQWQLFPSVTRWSLLCDVNSFGDPE